MIKTQKAKGITIMGKSNKAQVRRVGENEFGSIQNGIEGGSKDKSFLSFSPYGCGTLIFSSCQLSRQLFPTPGALPEVVLSCS